MPTRWASRPCLFLFFFLCSSFLAFFLGGGESGFEPREGGEPTESASRILAIGMPRSLRAGGVRASDFIHWENTFIGKIRAQPLGSLPPENKMRPTGARLGGLSGWLAQMRALGLWVMQQAAFPGLPTKAWLLRAGRRSFESSARQWARGRSKWPGRPLRRKSADVCVEDSNAVGSAGLQGRIGAF